MRTRTKVFSAAVALALAGSLAACGSDDDEGSSSSPSIAVSHAAGSVPGDMPFYTTKTRLEDDGWTVKDLTFDAPDQVLSAVVNDDANFGYLGTLDILKLIQQDAPIKLLFQNRPEEFVMVGGPDVTSCADLEGKPFGIAFPGAPGTVLAYKWIESECGASVKEVVIPDGSNRVAAVASGEIDGTLLQYSDFLTLQKNDPDGSHLLMTFKDAFPGLLGLPFVVNTEWLQDHRDEAVDFVAAMLQTNKDATDDPTTLDAAAKKQLAPDLYAGFNDVIEAYNTGLGGFPADGAFTEESVQAMIDSAFDNGLLEGDKPTVDDVADLSVLDDAKQKVK